MDLQGKLALVLGLGQSGLAMARWLDRQGARVHVADSRETAPRRAALQVAVPSAVVSEGRLTPNTFAEVDLVALSPGVSIHEPLVQDALARGVPVFSEIELFARALHHLAPRTPVLAITGSNGKTTTTALAGSLCRAAGRTAAVAGNISPAALDALMDAIDRQHRPDVWVLELSSFQLEATHTLEATAATLLNISSDHLDRHADLDAYAAVKARVFAGDGVMVLNRDDPRSLGCARAGRTVITFGLNPPPGPADYGIADGWIRRGDEPIVRGSDLRLVGPHNAANAMAALALCEAIGIAPRSVSSALAAFPGLAHRVERIAEVRGVSYFDDSKGTNVGATLAAIQGLDRPLMIILGGDGKGQDFAALRPAIREHARGVALIGRDAALIATALADCDVAMRFCADMHQAVHWCANQARPGDAVLLSPACASMDMYRDYAHRAQVFAEAVRELEEEAA